MIDTWSVHVIDRQGAILGKFDLIDNPGELNKLSFVNPNQGFTNWLTMTPGKYSVTGVAEEANVYKNCRLHGIIVYPSTESVISGQDENRPVLLHKDHISNVVIAKSHKPGYEPTLIVVPRNNPDAVCTCGVKFTGGICSDWCDLNQ